MSGSEAIERIHYRGRFAPTPSGPLHLGSLMTAVASYLQARCQKGTWLLRIDDLDSLRNAPDAEVQILAQLEAHGLHWDESPRYQSQHQAEYRHCLELLRARHRLYGCSCTRAQLRLSALPGPDEPVYPGTCRHSGTADSAKHALRVLIGEGTLCFEDGGLGRQCRQLAHDVGDFVLLRSDGVLAYQLACAVDEAAQKITEVMRGADLLGSTFRQLFLQQELGLPHARYHHLPVLHDQQGLKLSKQNHALGLDNRQAAQNLWRCLDLLGQHPPPDLAGETPAIQLNWAATHWRVDHIPAKTFLHLE